jgi:hypothetical protein
VCKTWVLRSLASKWRNWKAKLKSEHYYPHKTDEERLNDRDRRVLPEQWAILISYWNSEEAQVCASDDCKICVIPLIFSHIKMGNLILLYEICSCVVQKIRPTAQTRRVPTLQAQRVLQGYVRKR